MDYISQLEDYNQEGKNAIEQYDFENALSYFYKGALLAKQLEEGAPNEGLAKIWRSHYESFKKSVEICRKKQKNYKKTSKTQKKKSSRKPSRNKKPQNNNNSDDDENNHNSDNSSNYDEELAGNLSDEEAEFVSLEPSNKNFTDIIGLEKAKSELQNLQIFFQHPEYFEKLNVQPLRGILLFGPPGCGKTFLIECARGEFEVNLVTASAAELKGKYVGESENRAKVMFSAAKKAEPCILFIDEIDKILPAERGENTAIKGLLQVFLVELIKEHPEFITIMATNYPSEIETAIIMNKKRVNNIIYVGPPDVDAREKIFQLGLKDVKLETGLSFNKIISDLAKSTNTTPNGSYYSASNCSEFCERLKRKLIDRWFKENNPNLPLRLKDIETALAEFKPDISADQIQMYEKFAEEWAQK